MQTYIFQAIPCHFVGVVPLSSIGKWTDNVCDDIYANIIQNIEDGNIFAMPVREIANTNSYSIVLVECTVDGPIKINDKLVNEQYAEYDESTKHFIDASNTDSIYRQEINVTNSVNGDSINEDANESDNSSELSENWDHFNEPSYEYKPAPQYKCDSDFDEDDFDVAFTDSQIYDLFPQLRPMRDAAEAGPLKAIAEDPHKVITETLVAEKDVPIKRIGPQLSYICKVPQVEWDQKPDKISLSILAVDVTQYDLHVTERTLHLW